MLYVVCLIYFDFDSQHSIVIHAASILSKIWMNTFHVKKQQIHFLHWKYELSSMNNHNEIKCERMDAYVLFQLFQ